MLDVYGTARDQIIDALDKLKRLAAERGSAGVATTSADAEERLRENRFNLVVLGEFKRGKSTFINSLLGKELLPTAVVPLTSAVTVVRYGEEEYADILFQDGRKLKVTTADLPAYITESGNPENRKHVAGVEVFQSSPILQEGLQLIDTPGVGSVYEHNTEVAQEFLPRADAAVFLIASDPPISNSEREFLRRVKQCVPRIFFVQNKVDHLLPTELQESLEFNRRIILQELGYDSIRIFPVSARLGLEGKASSDQAMLGSSNLSEFEQELGSFLMKERGLISLLSGVNVAVKAASDIRVGIELERKAVQTPVEELEEKLRLFNDRLAAIRKQKEEDLYLLEQVLNKLVVEQLDADLAALRSSQRRPLHQRLIQISEESTEGNAAATLEHLNDSMPDIVQEVLAAWQAVELPKVSGLLNDRLQNFTDRINLLIDQVHGISEDVFDLKLEHFNPDQKLGGFSRFFVRTWNVRVNFDFSMVPFLHILPGRWMRGRILRAAWERLWQQFDMHCGQMRYDFVQRMQSSIREYAKTLDAKIEDTADGIESAIRKAMYEKARGQAAVDVALTQLDSELHIVNEVISKLLDIRDNLGSSTQPWQSASTPG